MGTSQEDVIRPKARGEMDQHKTGMKRRWTVAALSIGILIAILALGPRPAKPHPERLALHSIKLSLEDLEDSIRQAEASMPLRPDNEARILWVTPHRRTPVSMVYIPGNGASQEEGDPIHEALAARYGCNMFLARLAEHGIESEEPMLDLTADAWLQSALDAIQVGKVLGDKVIVVSCSTGSTLALYLAARFPDLVDGHILLSPNIDLFDPRASVLAMPWGLYAGRWIAGSKDYTWSAPKLARTYWYTTYRVEALTTLKTLLDATMTDATFSAIDEPVLMLYYYRDEEHQDKVVSVSRMRTMFEGLGTPPGRKLAVALPDAGTHIIASDMFNPHLESVWAPLTDFCETVLGLDPVIDVNYTSFLDPRD